jgi:hypothetical protein
MILDFLEGLVAIRNCRDLESGAANDLELVEGRKAMDERSLIQSALTYLGT